MKKTSADRKLQNEQRFRRYRHFIQQTINFGMAPNSYPSALELSFAADCSNHLQAPGSGYSPTEVVEILEAYRDRVEMDFRGGEWGDKVWKPILLFNFLNTYKEELQAALSEGSRFIFRENDDHSFLIVFGGRKLILPRLKGLDYIRHVLMRPNQAVPALHLERIAAGYSMTIPEPNKVLLELTESMGFRISDWQVANPVSDERALRKIKQVRDEYKERLEAEPDPQERLDIGERLAKLEAFYNQGIGLRGKARELRSEADLARRRVRRNIEYALEKIKEQSPALANHLVRHIKTGYSIEYGPHPDNPISWSF